VSRRPDARPSNRRRPAAVRHAPDDTDDELDDDPGPVAGAAPRGARPGMPRLPRLWWGRRRGWLVSLVGAGVAQAAIVLAVVAVARWAFTGGGAPNGVTGVIALAVLLLAAAALHRWQRVRAERLAQDLVADVRLALFDALAGLPAERRGRRSRGGVMLRFVGDAQALRAWAGFGLPALATVLAAWPALVAGLALLDGRLAAAALVWAALAAAGMALTLPPLARAIREARRRQAYVAANVHDRIATLVVMQAAGRRRRERRRLERQNARLVDATTARAAAEARHRFVLDLSLVGLVVSVPAIALATAPTAAGVAGAGGAFTFVGAIGLAGLLASPLRRTGRALEQAAAARVAQERIEEFLGDADPAPAPAAAGVPFDASVELHAWRGPSAAGAALSVHAGDGLRVALIGAPGSGKSALLEALAGLRPARAAGCRIGGVPLESIPPSTLQRMVAVVAPEHLPLRGTVRGNLRYRAGAATDEDVARACEAAGFPPPADEAAARRRVHDAGENLGGEERRALVLARALVGRPRLLLVDDAERCLPAPAGESLRRLAAHHAGTLVYATHDPALAAMADVVWDLSAPRAAEAPSPRAERRLVAVRSQPAAA
jgi:ABC-type multidrug transport system fused ATPase/permease subunit